MNPEQNKFALKLALTTPCWKLVSMYKECKADPEKFMESNPDFYVRENFDFNYGDGDDYDKAKKDGVSFLKLSGGILLAAVLISLVLFIWAIVLLAKYGKTMPTWALVVGIILLFFGGSVVTIILAYVTKGMKKNKY